MKDLLMDLVEWYGYDVTEVTIIDDTEYDNVLYIFDTDTKELIFVWDNVNMMVIDE